MQTINGHDFQEDRASGALIHWVVQCRKCQEDLKTVAAPKAETA